MTDTTKYPVEARVLAAAKIMANERALALWERDEKQDRGACGGACLELKGGTRLTKAAREMGLLRGLDGTFVSIDLPEGVRTQNADIYQGQMQAFRDVLIGAGYGAAIKRFWTYID